MKANVNLNRSLFRTFGGNTSSLSSSVILCHPLPEPGAYAGVVYRNKHVLGRFTVTCDESTADTQVDIDLPLFMTTGASDCDCHTNRHYGVAKGGYLVFFSSTGEDGFQVELTPALERSSASAYSTTKPVAGDIVLLTLMRPGSYQLTDARNQTSILSIKGPESPERAGAYQAEAHTLRLTDNGFSSREASGLAGQPVVIMLESGGSIDVKLIRPDPTTDATDAPKKHRWQRPGSR